MRDVSRKLASAVQQRQKLLSDAWLTEIGHSRPGMKRGVPVEEATRRAEMMKKELRKEIIEEAAEKSDRATGR